MASFDYQHDFSSPFLEATLITDSENGVGTGERFQFWTNFGGQGSGTGTLLNVPVFAVDGLTASGADDSIEFSSLAFLSAVTVELGLGYIPQITATLTPPFEDARKFLDSKLIAYGRSLLEVRLGYSTGPRQISGPPFVGIIQQPTVSYGTDFSIGFTALGSAAYIMKATGASGIPTTEASRFDLIELLASKVGVTFDEKGSLVEAEELALLQQTDRVATSTQSNLDLAFELAKKCGCWMDLLEGGTKFRLVSMRSMLLQQPKATLSLYDYPMTGIGPGSGIYPILGVSTESVATIYLDPGTKNVSSTSTDKANKQVVSQTSTQAEVTSSEKGQTGVNDTSNKESRIAVPGPANDAEVPNIVSKTSTYSQEMSTSGAGAGTKLEIETLGFPDLLPGMVINVAGLGTRIDGKYAVFQVKHDLSSAGFSTSITAIRNSAAIQEEIRNSAILPKQENQNKTEPGSVSALGDFSIDAVSITAVVG